MIFDPPELVANMLCIFKRLKIRCFGHIQFAYRLCGINQTVITPTVILIVEKLCL